MNIALQLFTSCLTLTSMWMAGRGDQRFNYVGLVANCGWWAFTISTHSWGIAPLNAALAIVYGWNLYKWKKEK